MDRDVIPASQGENALLAALPEEERTLFLGEVERVPLAFKRVLQELDEPVTHLWFPRSGVASMLSEMTDGSIVEVATVGREGVLGLPLVLDAGQSAQRVLVQIPGEADRMTAAAFARLRPRLPGLERLLLRYALSLVTQVSQGSACNRLHPIEARCARWLLLTHDRVDGDSFPLTHEFLSQMLGVTRPSVTIAAGMLQRAGLIRYGRGVVEVLDRAGLEGASCECYGVITREFRRLLRAD
ncbi:Crp/Fnr family transcriptional regulator [Muricoccus radiodurans]|uniref:Crp/Fnr family transcriptional regulator n=1 Tax=Muricoccus radiodurans TaxID=2231721 RepID=UPI003CE9B119